ncbi:hypothetical protein ACH3XW_10000 [Acanthocheilonema viteae]
MEVRNSAFRVSSSSNDTVSHESSGNLETSSTTFFGASFGLAQLPGSVKPENLMPALSERPVTLTAMSDAAAATAAAVACDSRIISATPYYNSGYSSANYAGMYAASGTQNYYPVVSSSLRGSAAAAAAATSFPFGAAAAASHAYYGNGYPSAHFDYTSYPAAMHCYAGRSGYYGCSINPVSPNSSLYAMNSLTNDMNTSNQLSSFTTKHETKRSNKATKRKKNPGSISSPEKQYKRAFIWEMEDVCVLSNFFLRSNDPIRNERLAQTINNNVDRLIASIFGTDQDDQDCEYVNIEDANIDDTFDDITYTPTNIDTPSTSTMSNQESSLLGHARGGVDWMRKLAAKYQHIKDTYNSYKDNFAGLLERTGNTERAELLALKSAMDPLTQGWGESIGQCLKLIIDRSSREHYANVLLTGENIVSTLAKLLIMEQSSMIPAENVYSMMKIGKEAVIDRILSQFGKKCSFVIISTHLDTHEIAKKENIPLWKVKSVRDLDLFHLALNHHLLS